MKNVIFLFLSILCIYACKKSVGENPVIATHNHHLKLYSEQTGENLNYEIKETFDGDGWTEYRTKMISGDWLTTEEVVSPEWWHWVTVIVPDEVNETEAMMVIGGGTAHDSLPLPAEGSLIKAAVTTRSIIAYISNIPFQPIDYLGDEKDGTFEDELIAYGWAKFLEGGAKDEDVKWLARMPMTRAVVKGMDLVEEIGKIAGKPVEKFVVTGASKRGWTTWTTAVVDDRVIAIIPVVIDLLNVVPSFHHHWKSYGEWSPAITDYINEGIMEWMDSKEYDRLLELVEPYSFIDSLYIPKFLVNAAGDEFFLTDSWKFYWDDLKGDNYLQYVPNGNHGLEGTYNPKSIMAFYQAVITDVPIPVMEWDINDNLISVSIDPEQDYTIRKWEAVNPDGRDFRVPVIDRSWVATELSLTEDGKYNIEIVDPNKGFRAGLVEVTINPEADYPFTFTSGTVVTPDKYPFGGYNPVETKGTPKENEQ